MKPERVCACEDGGDEGADAGELDEVIRWLTGYSQAGSEPGAIATGFLTRGRSVG